MRNFLTLILFFISTNLIFACSCLFDNFAQAYLESDIVAVVTIDNTYGNKEFESNGMPLRSYSADLKFNEIFKGKEFKTLNVLGSTNYAYSSACERLVEKGQKYLIMINERKEYLVSACSKMMRIESKDIPQYEKIFTLIEKNKSNISSKRFVSYHDISRKFDKRKKQIISDFSLIKTPLKGSIGIYSVNITDDGKVEKIVPIAEIGKNEKKIQQLIKKNFIVENDYRTTKGEYLILLEL